jgi:hypothetical protein
VPRSRRGLCVKYLGGKCQSREIRLRYSSAQIPQATGEKEKPFQRVTKAGDDVGITET